MQAAVLDIEAERLERDPHYLEEVTQVLLTMCGRETDHVELRRTASRAFPALARPPHQRWLGALVGHAATMRAEGGPRDERDVTDARLDLTPTEPLAYPTSYARLDEDTRAMLIAFCEREIKARRDGPQALVNLMGLHGWPFSERTFYVGPWKAARMRRRRRDGDD